MTQKTLDATGNESADIFRDKVGKNFTDLYALVAAITPHTGTFTANGASAVTVADTNVTANSSIDITLKTVGGTVGAIPHVATITPGTGFTVVGTASDTSVYNYAIVG